MFPTTFESGPMPKGIPYPEYYDFFMHWKTPFTIATVYCVSVALFNPKVSKVSRVVAKDTFVVNIKGKGRAGAAKVSGVEKSESGPAMTAFVFAHNLILCVYSAATFYNMAPALVNSYRTHDFFDAFCDTDHSFWNNALGYWGYLFYLSKFYEIIDTIILLLKGRRSSLLQTYHHAGAIITMWSGINYQANPIWIFVVFNSFIHTFMYCYYACTSIGLHPPGKKYLTTMQITQFLIGASVALIYLFTPGCIPTSGAQAAVWVNVVYLFPLTYLFVDFAKRTYSKNVNASAAGSAIRSGKKSQ